MTFGFSNIFSEEKECSPSLRESAPNPKSTSETCEQAIIYLLVFWTKMWSPYLFPSWNSSLSLLSGYIHILVKFIFYLISTCSGIYNLCHLVPSCTRPDNNMCLSCGHCVLTAMTGDKHILFAKV